MEYFVKTLGEHCDMIMIVVIISETIATRRALSPPKWPHRSIYEKSNIDEPLLHSIKIQNIKIEIEKFYSTKNFTIEIDLFLEIRHQISHSFFLRKPMHKYKYYFSVVRYIQINKTCCRWYTHTGYIAAIIIGTITLNTRNITIIEWLILQ